MVKTTITTATTTTTVRLLSLAILWGQSYGYGLVRNDFFPLPKEATADSNTYYEKNDTQLDLCPLNCKNGSTCEPGDQDTTGHMFGTEGTPLFFHKELNREGWHCHCPDGYTGLQCQTVFQTCGNGQRVCYHGGICKTSSSTNDFYGTGESYCDCNTAVDPDNPYVKFTGEYCTEAIMDIQACESGGMCKNGGLCKRDPSTPCACPEGYFGKRCEYVQEIVPTCTKGCMNGGECKLEDGKEYCDCPDSHYGEFCEKAKQKCGERYCENGGQCYEIILSNGIAEHMCDCTPGYTDTTHFSGEFCQYPSTTFCSEPDDPNGRQFCTNGGTCPDSPYKPCTCPSGFSGPRCAFKNGEDGLDYAECDLPCMNGGTCQKGFKDLDQVYEMFPDEIEYLVNETHQDFEHCVCPEGFYGIRCEYEVDDCDAESYVCLHGSTCRENKGRSSCVCENSDHLTAGLYCEFFATQQCDKTLAPPEPGHRGFCTNGGLCIVTDGELGCSCPVGFDGPHCEYRIDEENSIPTIEAPPEEITAEQTLSPSAKLAIVASVFAVFGILVWFMVFHPAGSWVARRAASNKLWAQDDNLAVGEESDSEAPTRVRRGGNGLSSLDYI